MRTQIELWCEWNEHIANARGSRRKRKGGKKNNDWLTSSDFSRSSIGSMRAVFRRCDEHMYRCWGEVSTRCEMHCGDLLKWQGDRLRLWHIYAKVKDESSLRNAKWRRHQLHQSIKRNDQWTFALRPCVRSFRRRSKVEQMTSIIDTVDRMSQGNPNRSHLWFEANVAVVVLLLLSLIVTTNVCLVNTSWNHMPNGSRRLKWIEVSFGFVAGMNTCVCSPCFFSPEWSIGIWWSEMKRQNKRRLTRCYTSGRTSSIFDDEHEHMRNEHCVHLWTSIWQAIINFTALLFIQHQLIFADLFEGSSTSLLGVRSFVLRLRNGLLIRHRYWTQNSLKLDVQIENIDPDRYLFRRERWLNSARSEIRSQSSWLQTQNRWKYEKKNMGQSSVTVSFPVLWCERLTFFFRSFVRSFDRGKLHAGSNVWKLRTKFVSGRWSLCTENIWSAIDGRRKWSVIKMKSLIQSKDTSEEVNRCEWVAFARHTMSTVISRLRRRVDHWRTKGNSFMFIGIDEDQSSLTDSSISRFDSTAFVWQLLSQCSRISFLT